MRFLRRISTVLLLVLWLPATLHCELEIAGLIAADACCQPAEDDAAGHDGCHAPACAIIEDGGYGPFANPALLKAPALLLAPFAAAPLVAEPRDVITFDRVSAARLELQRTWQFDRRAARPARAP